jgi:hypothetical protein
LCAQHLAALFADAPAAPFVELRFRTAGMGRAFYAVDAVDTVSSVVARLFDASPTRRRDPRDCT